MVINKGQAFVISNYVGPILEVINKESLVLNFVMTEGIFGQTCTSKKSNSYESLTTCNLKIR